jgi:hypothetical protein
VEINLVDPLAEAIVRTQLRRIGVRLEAPVDRLLGSGEPAKISNPVLSPGRAFPLERLA